MIHITPELETYLEALIKHHIDNSLKQTVNLNESSLNKVDKRLNDVESAVVQIQRRIERIIDNSLYSSSSKPNKKQ